MPLVPFSKAFLSLGKDTGAHDPLLPGGPMSCQSAPGLSTTLCSPDLLMVNDGVATLIKAR
ncbi:unnamed protein product, partial [Staurois parvus]